MRNICKIFSFICVFLFIQSVYAITPENGWWWNPQESGMGFNIETQNDTVFIATFVYDNQGNPIWYSGSTRIGSDTASIDLQLSQNGSCLTCAYHAPKTASAGIPITLSFTSQGSGTAIWQGKTIAIQRFGFNFGAGVQALVGGKWIFNIKTNQSTEEYRKIKFNIGQDGTLIPTTISTGSYGYTPITNASTTISTNNLYQSQNYPYIIKTLNSSYIILTIFNFSGLNKITGIIVSVPNNFDTPAIQNTFAALGTPIEGYRIVE